jgi:nucleoside diphosphate kinase
MQRTLVLLKPDCVQRRLVGTVISRFEQKGLRLVALKLVQASRTLAEEHYAVHKGKPFYESLLGFLASGPTVAIVLEGREAVAVRDDGNDRRNQGGAGDDPRRFRAQRAEQSHPRQRQSGERAARNFTVVFARRTGELPACRRRLDRVGKIPRRVRTA